MRGQPSLDFTIIAVPNARETHATAIDDMGNILGYTTGADDIVRAYVLVANSNIFTMYDYPGATSTAFLGIDPSGTTGVGTFNDRNGAGHGLVVDLSSWIATQLDAPGAVYTFVGGINDSGTKVGGSLDPSFVLHGVQFDNNGNYTQLDAPGAVATALFSINNLGQGVGFCKFGTGGDQGCQLDTVVSIWRFDNAVKSFNGINFYGQSAASCDGADGVSHGCLVANGNLSVVEPPGAVSSVARAINNSGVVVGDVSFDGVTTCGFVAKQQAPP